MSHIPEPPANGKRYALTAVRPAEPFDAPTTYTWIETTDCPPTPAP